MSKNVVITGAGQDRVGIVADLSDFLFACGCNLLDSSMTLLRGSFALIVMATLPDSLSVDDLAVKLGELSRSWDLMLSVRELTETELNSRNDHAESFMIAVYGADRPGIVSSITRRLAELRMNITDVETKSSVNGNKSIFVMLLEVSSPGKFTAAQLQQELFSCSSPHQVDISVQELETVEF